MDRLDDALVLEARGDSGMQAFLESSGAHMGQQGDCEDEGDTEQPQPAQQQRRRQWRDMAGSGTDAGAELVQPVWLPTPLLEVLGGAATSCMGRMSAWSLPDAVAGLVALGYRPPGGVGGWWHRCWLVRVRVQHCAAALTCRLHCARPVTTGLGPTCTTQVIDCTMAAWSPYYGRQYRCLACIGVMHGLRCTWRCCESAALIRVETAMAPLLPVCAPAQLCRLLWAMAALRHKPMAGHQDGGSSGEASSPDDVPSSYQSSTGAAWLHALLTACLAKLRRMDDGCVRAANSYPLHAQCCGLRSLRPIVLHIELVAHLIACVLA
jgi:hypothetical protein